MEAAKLTSAAVARLFVERFDAPATVIASAPGRVNLIGEHTDYSEGFVLPMAIAQRAWVAFSPRDDDRAVVHALDYHESVELRAADCEPAPRDAWPDLVRGVLCELARAGADASAMSSPACDLAVERWPSGNYLIASDVPRGAGLSSSAAVAIALARTVSAAIGMPWVPLAAARIAQRAEHAYLGVRSGIMDPMAAAASQRGTAMLLDCRTLDLRRVTVPTTFVIVVMDTGARRTLAGSEYNDRHDACVRAAEALRVTRPQVQTLRDVTLPMLDAARGLPEILRRRARHVVSENQRVGDFADALESGDALRAGALLDESHRSLRDDYEVTGPHLDTICELARGHPSCFGARMTGAGFGGCAVALVDPAGMDAFLRDVPPAYEARTYARSRFFTATPGDGAMLHAR